VQAGSLYEKPVMGFDCHATALAAAGVRDTTVPEIDGVDLLPFLKDGRNSDPHKELFWRTGTKYAMRRGDWKLVNERTGGQVLFNLKKDPQETTDVSSLNRKIFSEMKAGYQDWSGSLMKPQWKRQDQDNAYPGGKLKTNPQNSGRKKNLKRDVPATK
jgi:arylsulfatase A-like enzyme